MQFNQGQIKCMSAFRQLSENLKCLEVPLPLNFLIIQMQGYASIALES